MSWVSWGDGGQVKVPMHRVSPMDQHALAGCVRKGFSWFILTLLAFALEIQARCKQHDSPWKPFSAGHKRVD